MAKYGGRHRRAYFSLSKEFLGKTLPDLLLTTSIPSSLPELNYISAFDTARVLAQNHTRERTWPREVERQCARSSSTPKTARSPSVISTARLNPAMPLVHRFSERVGNAGPFVSTTSCGRLAPKAVIGGAHNTVGFNPGDLQGNKSGAYGSCSPAATTRQGCP